MPCPGREVRNDSVVGALVLGALMLLPLGWLAFVGMRTLSVGLLGKLLQLEADPADKRYPEFRDEMYGSVWRQLAAAGGVVIASWLVSLQTMDPLTVFWTRSPGVMLFATGYLILIAGVAADAVRNVVTLAFIKAGADPQRTFWDDLAAALFTVAVMLYFSNGPVAIAAALLVPAVSPWMFRKLGRLAGPGGPSSSAKGTPSRKATGSPSSPVAR
jgi:hypothetical protein